MRLPALKTLVLPALLALTLAIVAALFLTSGPEPAPDMRVKTLRGDVVELSSLRGKAVLVNFWATSCATCIEEMPDLVRLHQEWHPRGLEIVAVAMQYDPPNYVLNYAETRRLPFKVALDIDGSAAAAFGGILGTPTTYAIDPQGRIFKRYLGIPDWNELRQWLGQSLPSS